MKKSTIVTIVIGLLVIGAVYLFTTRAVDVMSGTAVDCGSTTCFTTVGVLTSLQIDGTFKMGSSSPATTQVIDTTCNLIFSQRLSIAASSSAAVDCAITGIAPGDKVMAFLATSTPGVMVKGPGWAITQGTASSTPGYATFLLTNWSGDAANPAVTAVGSSTVIHSFRVAP